jgi:hypothetical protein
MPFLQIAVPSCILFGSRVAKNQVFIVPLIVNIRHEIQETKPFYKHFLIFNFIPIITVILYVYISLKYSWFSIPLCVYLKVPLNQFGLLSMVFTALI